MVLYPHRHNLLPASLPFLSFHAGPQAHLSEVDEDVDVEPLLGGAAAAPPRTRAAPRRGSSSSSGLGFWGTSALVLVVSCLVSAVLLR